MTDEDVSALVSDSNLSVLQTSLPVENATWELLNNQLFSSRPDVTLRVFGFYSDICDLTFLKRVGNVRRFSADCLKDAVGLENVGFLNAIESLSIGIYSLTDFGFLDEVISENLIELSLGPTKSKKPSLHGLDRFRGIRKLGLAGQQKQIEIIGTLDRLEELNLASVTVQDLNFLRKLDSLWSLALILGGTRNLSALAGNNSIKYLELSRVKGLRDIRILSQMGGLQSILLRDLPQVDALPDLTSLPALRRIFLDNMSGLQNIGAVAGAPSLEQFIHVAAKGIEPTAYTFLTKLKRLRKATVGFGSEKKNRLLRDELEQAGISSFSFAPFEFQ